MSFERHKWKSEHTCPTLLHFYRGVRKNVQDLDHYLHHHVRHRRSWGHLGVNFESFKEIFEALKDIDKDVLAFFDILSSLRILNVTSVRTNK